MVNLEAASESDPKFAPELFLNVTREQVFDLQVRGLYTVKSYAVKPGETESIDLCGLGSQSSVIYFHLMVSPETGLVYLKKPHVFLNSRPEAAENNRKRLEDKILGKTQ